MKDSERLRYAAKSLGTGIDGKSLFPHTYDGRQIAAALYEVAAQLAIMNEANLSEESEPEPNAPSCSECGTLMEPLGYGENGPTGYKCPNCGSTSGCS